VLAARTRASAPTYIFRNLSTADEVDNLQLITFGQCGFCPLIAGNDASVQFYGDAIRFHPQLADKTGQRERRVEIAGLAIDLQFHD